MLWHKYAQTKGGAKSKIAFGDVYLNKKEVKNKWKK